MKAGFRSRNEWVNQFGDRGNEIYDVIRPFCEEPLRLQPPTEDLKVRLIKALEFLRVPFHELAIVRLSRFVYLAASDLPELLVEQIQEALRTNAMPNIPGMGVLSRSVEPYGDMFAARFHEDIKMGLGLDLAYEIFKEVTKEFQFEEGQKRIRQALGENDFHSTIVATLACNLAISLYVQVAFRVGGQCVLEEQASVYPKFFLEGCFPLWLFRDGTFVALSALDS